MYLSILPTSHALDDGGLLYFCEEGLRELVTIGSLVEIPLGSRLVMGVVESIQDGSGEWSFEIRSIARVICSTPILDPQTLAVVKSLAHDLYLPIHRVLLLFLPRSFVTWLEKQNFEPLFSLDQDESRDRGASMGWLHIFYESRVTPAEIEPFLTSDTLVVVPDEWMLRACRAYFWERQDTRFISDLETTPARWKSWLAIRGQKHSLIFATRRLLLMPIARYQRILYIEDALWDDYFQLPYTYRYRDILARWDSQTPIAVEILTSAPLISTLSTFRHFPISHHSWPPTSHG